MIQFVAIMALGGYTIVEAFAVWAERPAVVYDDTARRWRSAR